MNERWQDALKALGRRNAPTPAETERFTRAVMARLQPRPSPWAARLQGLLQARWLVPALSLGLATVFLSIGRQSDALGLDLLIGGPGNGASALLLPASASSLPLAGEAP